MTARIARWYAALLADPDLPDAPRVLGMDLAYSGAVDPKTGNFTWDMAAICARLNRPATRIKERRVTLRRAGYVEPVRGSAPGRPAVWAIVIPTARRGPMTPDRVRGPMETVRVGVPEPDRVPRPHSPMEPDRVGVGKPG